MARISIEDMAFYAFHGCFEEEQTIGTRFLLDLSFDYDTKHAEITDKLSSTIDYQDVYKTVKTEMMLPSKLLEHVGRRIVDAVKFKYVGVKNISLKISKCNPPLGGQIGKVSIIIEEK